MVDVLDPKFYRSWEHLEALINGIEEQNNAMPHPPGGQQAGIDKSWNAPYNTFLRKRELNWYCRALREVAKAIKEDTA
jgi:hypothetical protein